MGKEEMSLEYAKRDYLNTPLQEVPCRWCGEKTVNDIGEVKGFAFVECDNCGFIFCPYISQDLMNHIYSAVNHANKEGVPEFGWSDVGFLRQTLELFSTPQDPLKILDFGCGQSRVPEKLRREGHQVIAVDMQGPMRPHPDRVTGNILHLHLEPDQFDLVYSFQVFEHLPEPLPVFKELLNLTKSHHYLMIHTDMETPEREKGFDQWWYVLPPKHCSYYRTITFKKALEESPHLLLQAGPKYVIIQKNGKLNKDHILE